MLFITTVSGASGTILGQGIAELLLRHRVPAKDGRLIEGNVAMVANPYGTGVDTPDCLDRSVDGIQIQGIGQVHLILRAAEFRVELIEEVPADMTLEAEGVIEGNAMPLPVTGFVHVERMGSVPIDPFLVGDPGQNWG